MTDRELWEERLATWFGCGYSKVAPGTVGSVGALPLHFLLSRLGGPWHLAAVVAISAVGIAVSDATSERSGEKDPQKVVIDEVAGTLIAMGMVRRRSLKAQLLALVLFRAFDITKPGPVGAAEDLEPRGVGIMADDLLAGFMAGLVARWLSPKR